MERVAVIDLGSNSFRLVVFGVQGGRYWLLDDEIREPVRVSAGMGEEALLRPEPMARATRTAEVFAAFCRAAGIGDVNAVATSAIRDAVNGPDLVAEIEARTGLAVRVISPEEEARYGYLAMVNSTTLRDGFGVDVGGGSVQVVAVRDRGLTDVASWPLGAVRTSEAFLPDAAAPSRKALKGLRRHVRAEMASAPWFRAGPGRERLVGIGGTVRNLATAAQRVVGDPSPDVQGFVLEGEVLEALVDELASRPAAKRAGVAGIKPDRADVILGGAVVLAEVMARGGFQGVEVVEAGLREGVFFERLLEARDPPLFDDVRRESVLTLARRFHFDEPHVEHVARLSAELYERLGAVGRWKADDGERELLWAAAMLHDIGVAIDYDDHHRHSRYLILNAGLPGWTPREVALVALLARYHRKGDPDVDDLGPLARYGDERRLVLLSGLLRLAEQLERSRDQSVRSVGVREEGGVLCLSVEADDRAEVAIWSARRHVELLERVLGVDVEIAEPVPA